MQRLASRAKQWEPDQAQLVHQYCSRFRGPLPTNTIHLGFVSGHLGGAVSYRYYSALQRAITDFGVRDQAYARCYLVPGIRNRRYWRSYNCSRVTPVASSSDPGRETDTTTSAEVPHTHRVRYKIPPDPEYHVLSLLTVAYLRPFDYRMSSFDNLEGVSFVFFLVGLTIKLGELAGAALNVRLNVLIQAFSLGVLPAVGMGLARLLAAGGMNPALADGVLILVSGRPLWCNMCRGERRLIMQ